MKRALKSLAARRGVPVAELIRQSVDDFIRSSVGLDDLERRQRAMAAAGRFHSGISDIAVNHDDYLAEAYFEVIPTTVLKMDSVGQAFPRRGPKS